MSTVLVLGTFDGLHKGHEDYFRQAKEHGDRVVAVVARDRTVLDVKGQLPRIGEEARRRAVHDHALVDLALLGREGDKLDVVRELKPDVIVLGYDQEAFTDDLEDKLRARGLNCRVVRAEAYHPDVYKSSLLNGLVTSDQVETEPVADWLPL